MKRLDAYIMKDLAATFILALAALNLVVMTEKVLWLTRVLSSVGLSIGDMLHAVALMQPQVTVITIPMAYLTSVLLTYGRLGADSELTVMLTSGIPLRRLCMPAFILGLLCFLASLGLSLYAAPLASRKLTAAVADTVARRAPKAIEAGLFNTAFDDILIYVRQKPAPDIYNGIFIYDERKADRPLMLYAASGAISVRDDPARGYTLVFDLDDGGAIFTRPEGTTELSFGRYVLEFPVSMKSPTRRRDELTQGDLLIEARAERGQRSARLYLEYHRRLSLPALCLALMFLAPPLALMAGKTGRIGGLSLALAVIACYYGALTYAENLVRSGGIPHAAGAWAPLALLMPISIYAFMRADSR